jgi:cbb3-type cytochrome oxidase maturation protein
MSLVSILIPVSLVLLGCGVWAFFWAVRGGQFEELDAASWEILIEERAAQKPPAAPAAEPRAQEPS